MNETITTFPTGKETFLLQGEAGPLEVAASSQTGEARKAVAIVCHPDPRFDGTMNNKVVTTMVRTFNEMGLKAVRFNFRGVGLSAGAFANAIGEKQDLLTVINWVWQVLPDYDVWLAGFSFGSYIAASVANELPAKRLLTIAPPVEHYDYTALDNVQCPWLIIQGDADEVVSPQAVFEFADKPPVPVKLITMEGVGHFFHGRLIELRDQIIENI